MKRISLVIFAFGTLLTLPSPGQTAGGSAGASSAGTAASTSTGVRTTTSANGSTTSGTVQNQTTVSPFTSINPNVNAQAQSGQIINNPNNPNAPAFAPAGTSVATNQGSFAATNNGSGTNQFAFTNSFGTNGFVTSSNQFEFSRTNTFASGTNAGGFTEFDQTLITRIRRVVFDPNAQINAAGVDFNSQGGVVTMNGVVATPAEVQLLMSRVQTIPGVVNVQSRLTINPQLAAAMAARNQQQNKTRTLAPTSDRSLGDSRIYSSDSNRFGVRNGTPTTQLPSSVSNRVEGFDKP